MSREYKATKVWIIQCGGVAPPVYLTKITKKKGEAPVYVYGSRDKRKALRFEEEEAKELAEKRQAIMVQVREEG